MSEAIRVVVVEDHVMTRVELLALLGNDSRFNVVVTANNFASALAVSESARFDILLLDLQLPDGNGVELIPYFRAREPAMKVIALTVHHDASHALQAMEHGVDAYVLKDDEYLKEHIVSVWRGDHPVDSRVTGYLLNRLVNELPANSGELTPRELQTLSGLYRGLSYSQLAEHMNISINTVPGYVKNLYRKLGVNSRSQAVYRASQLGLLN